MAHEHRTERPTRRGRIDDSGGDTEGGQKLYYHLTLLAESQTGYRNLIHLASKAFLEGYYYKPRLDWELLARHHDGLIATTGCLGGHVLQSLLQGDERGALEKAGPAAGHLRPRPPVRRAAGPRPRRPEGDQPEAARAGQAARRAGARHQRLALHPPRGPRGPRRPAVRADGRRPLRPEALQVRGPGALPQVGRRDALPVPRGAGGVRQHAVDRRAGRRRDRVRRAPAAQLPAARGLHRRRRLPGPRDLGGRPPALGRGAAGRRGRARPVRARHHRRHGVQLVLPDRLGPHQARQGRRHPRRARGAARRPAVPSPTPCASPTSTRSGTTCCSSASSTRAASRCPTSTWTSTPATGTR